MRCRATVLSTECKDSPLTLAPHLPSGMNCSPAGEGTKMSPETPASRTTSRRADSAAVESAASKRGSASVSQRVAAGSSNTSRHDRCGRTCSGSGSSWYGAIDQCSNGHSPSVNGTETGVSCPVAGLTCAASATMRWAAAAGISEGRQSHSRITHIKSIADAATAKSAPLPAACLRAVLNPST